MRLNRIFAVAATAALLATGMSACNRDGGAPADPSGGAAGGATNGSKTIAVVAKGYASPFWATVKAGAEAAGKDTGWEVTFNGPDNESDTPRQNDQLEQALVKSPAALVFAALDSEAQAATLKKFADANIPVVAFDSGVPGSDVPVSTVATNNVEAAAIAAEKMNEKLGGKGEVAIICHSQTSVTGTDREKGFREWMEKNAPDVKIVDVQYNNSDQAVAQQQTGAILQANPNLAGIFGTDDDSAVAIGQALKAAGRDGKVIAVGFDSGKPQIDLIKEGVLTGSVTQNPFQMGYDAVMRAIDVAEGKTLESFYDSGAFWYDATNLEDEDIKKAIYE